MPNIKNILPILRNDIIIFKHPAQSNKFLCKRICEPDADMRVPYGFVTVKGDNVDNSNDSRHFGALPYGLIESRVFVRVNKFN